MKHIIDYIQEALDDNIIWKLDKWFDSHESEKQEFMNLVFLYQDKKEMKILSDAIDADNKFSQSLKEIVHFTNDIIKPDSDINYPHELKVLITYLLDNKTSKNTYTKKG